MRKICSFITQFCSVMLSFVWVSCGNISNLAQLTQGEPRILTLPAQELLIVSIDVPYKDVIAAQGGISPYTYSLKKGELFEGLVFDPGTGAVKGQVSKAMFAKQTSLLIEVVDSSGLMAVQSYILKTAHYEFTVQPQEIQTIIPGVNYAVKFNAPGAVEPVEYSMSGALPVKLNLDSEGALMTEEGGISAAFANTEWPIEITARDALGVSRGGKYVIVVGAGPQTPELSILSNGLTAVQVGSFAGGIITSGGVAPLTFTIEMGNLPSGLNLNPGTGLIEGSIPSSAASQVYIFGIKVSDSSGQVKTKIFSGKVDVGGYLLTLHTLTLAQMTAATPYHAALTVTGGSTPYSFTIANGSLPSGLSLNSSSGVISGTPTPASSGQAYAFVITATDAASQSASRTYIMTVATSSMSSISIVTSTIPTPLAGSSYLAAIGVTGGTTPYTYSISSGSLPSGLSLNSSSGLISGSVAFAAKGAAYLFSITVTDSASISSIQAYSGFVTTYTTNLIPAAIHAANPGETYSVYLASTGGQVPYTYAITAGTLPSGLTLDTSAGLISGTIAEAEAGNTRNFTIKSTDNNNVQVFNSLSLTVNSFVVSLTTSTLAQAIENSNYSNNNILLAASGGTAPYTYEYTGTLPTGVGLTSGGSFFGTPGVGTGALNGSTPYTIHVRARDAAGRGSARVTLNLIVAINSPFVDMNTPSKAVLGSTYAYTVTASGGRSPYTFSIISGSLPTGLTMASTGVILGTAVARTSCPAANFTVRAVDVLGQNSAEVAKCLATMDGVNITNTSFPSVVVGSNYYASMIASGGTPPYTFTSTGLPTGISLNSSSGVLSGYVNDPLGDYTVFLSATDSSSPVVGSTRSFTFGVRDPVSLAAATLNRAGTGVAFVPQSLVATGGQPPYVFSISSGSLPNGLSLSSDGVIAGTPSIKAIVGSGTYTFLGRVTDALGQTSNVQSYTIYVTRSPMIKTSRLPSAVIGSAYAFDVERIGGVNTFISSSNLATRLNWLASGLPSGLSIHSGTGRISGTPNSGTATGSPYAVTISVSDAYGLVGSRTIPIEVRTAPLTLDMFSARTVEPCPAGGFNCEPNAYAVGALVPATASVKYMVYGALLAGSPAVPTSAKVYIARIDGAGRLATPGTSNLSVAYTPSLPGFITGLDIADLDNDTFADIVFSDRTNNKVVVVWNSGTVDANGMPVFSSETSFSMPASGSRPFHVKAVQLRPDALNQNKKDLIVVDYDILNSGISSARIAVFLAQNACSANCSASRESVYTGTGASITAYTTTLASVAANLSYIGGAGIGYFDTAAGPGVCPSIVITGRRLQTSADDYIYIRHQSYAAGQCNGNFGIHASSDEKMVMQVNANTIPSMPAIADLNNDGISDIAVVLRFNAIANSSAVKIYLMPGGNVFPAAPLTPNLPNTGANIVGGAIIPYCADGASQCSYPGLLVASGRDRGLSVMTNQSTATSAISLIPNQGQAPYFEDLSGNTRIDYYAPPGVGYNGIIAQSMVTPGLQDIVMMGVDNYANPYYYFLPRNSSSTTAPFRQLAMLRSMPAYSGISAAVGTMRLTDMNNDSELDLVSHLVNEGSLAIIPGNLAMNNPSSLPEPTLSLIGINFGIAGTWHYQSSMEVGDFNEDGYQDIVSAGNAGRAVSVSFGDGSDTIGASLLLGPGISGELHPRTVAVADFDNDSHLDIVSYNWNNTLVNYSMSFYKGRGDGSFATTSEFNLGSAVCNSEVRAMVAKDLNGDGRPELALLCYTSQALWILRRHTDGTWIKNSGQTINTAGGANGNALASGRLTSTVGYDLVVGGLDTINSLRMITGLQLTSPDSIGAFSVTSSLSPYMSVKSYLSSAEIADLNNDGFGDLVITPTSQNQGIGLNSSFIYTCRTTGIGMCQLDAWGGEGVGLTGIALGDINDDGKIDVFYGCRTGGRIPQRMISRMLNTSY